MSESCGCDSVNVGRPKREPAAFQLQVLPVNLPDKARIYPGTGIIQVGGPWWGTLSPAAKAAVLAHEVAHEEDPREHCESCVDMRAGAILRHQGWSRTAAVDAMRSTISSREGGINVGRGWDAADEALASGHAQADLNPLSVDAPPAKWRDSKAASALFVVVAVVVVVVAARKLKVPV